MEKSQILQQGLKQLNDFARGEMNLALNENMFTLARHDVDDYDAVAISSGDQKLLYTGFVQPWAPQKDITALIYTAEAIHPAPMTATLT